MAFYVFLGHNSPFPLYYPQNLSFFSSFNSPPSLQSMENVSQLPSASALAPSPDAKNGTDLPTVVPEQPQRICNDLSKNRRKREKNLERELISAKKNSQSNIINHFFTFFTAKQASLTLVRRAFLTLGKKDLELEKCLTIFFSFIRWINLRRGRRYINKAILCSYFQEERVKQSLEMMEKIDSVISARELSSVLRKCLFNFVEEVSLTSILTSKRISQHSKEIHLGKRRKISRFIKSETSKHN